MSTDRPDTPITIGGYEGFERIGLGGFSSVYRSRQTSLGREVAVKVLSAGFATESDRRTFERECHAMGLLSRHPNIVTVHSEAFTDDGRPCIVMELYRWNYRERLEQNGPLAASELLVLGIKIAGALQSAHDAGVLHRDIKPHNLFMSDYGEPALGDFGISTIGDERSVTGTGGLSVAYAAPEVLEDAQTDASSDVYSLAATLFHLFDGTAPFAASNIRTSVKRILTEPPPSPSRTDAPAGLTAELHRALSKHPEQRHRSANEFAESLRAVQVRLGLDRTTVPLANDRLIDEVSAEVSSVSASESPSYEFGNARLDPSPTDTIDHVPLVPRQLRPDDDIAHADRSGPRSKSAGGRRVARKKAAPSGLRRSSAGGESLDTPRSTTVGAEVVGEQTISRSEALKEMGGTRRTAPEIEVPLDTGEISPMRRRLAVGIGVVAIVGIGAAIVGTRGGDDAQTVTTTTVIVPEVQDDGFLAIAAAPTGIRVVAAADGTVTIDFGEADNAVAYLATAVEPSARAGATVSGEKPPLVSELLVDEAPCWHVQSEAEGRGLGRRSSVVCVDDQ